MKLYQTKLQNQVPYEKIFLMYKLFYRDNKEIVTFYSKCINLTHQIIQDVTKSKAKEFIKTKKQSTGAKAISELYEIKIAHNFVAHNTLLKNGVSLASYNPLRSIYEIIIKIYLNITFPDLGELNFKYEIRNSEQSKFSKEQIKNIERDYKKHQYFSTNFIEQKIYSSDEFREFYRNICAFVHPSILSMAACFVFKPKTFIDSCVLGIALTSSNFIVLYELYGNMIKKRYKKKLLEVFNEYPKFIPGGIPMLIPSVNQHKLKIKSYHELIDILKNEIPQN
jgi:hypothetical protein